MSSSEACRPSGEVTHLLGRWNAGDAEAFERLVPLVYGELRRMASRFMRREQGRRATPGPSASGSDTLQTTALVHETYLLLRRQDRTRWVNRAQFYGVVATLMRRHLLQRLERRLAEKRGAGWIRVPLAEDSRSVDIDTTDFLALDRALGRLREWAPRQARIVELRFWLGCTLEEIAEIFGASRSTVKRDWRMARAWLRRQLQGVDGRRRGGAADSLRLGARPGARPGRRSDTGIPLP